MLFRFTMRCRAFKRTRQARLVTGRLRMRSRTELRAGYYAKRAQRNDNGTSNTQHHTVIPQRHAYWTLVLSGCHDPAYPKALSISNDPQEEADQSDPRSRRWVARALSGAHLHHFFKIWFQSSLGGNLALVTMHVEVMIYTTGELGLISVSAFHRLTRWPCLNSEPQCVTKPRPLSRAPRRWRHNKNLCHISYINT